MPPAPKVTGNSILDSAISKLHKDMGKTLISLGPTIEQVDSLPTGSLALDIAVGIGGLPKGRCIELIGQPASGKTSLALWWVSQFLRSEPERYALIIDAEYTMTETLFTGFGIDMSRVLYVKPENAAHALDTALALVKTGQVGLMMLDSIDALQTEAQLAKGTGENEMGGISKPLNRFFREFSKVADTAKCTSLFVNQIKYNPGANYGASPETSSGGTGPTFYCSLIMKFMPARPSPTLKGAFNCRIKIVKNRFAPPVDRFIEFDFVYAKGPDAAMDSLHAAKNLGVVRFAGPTLVMGSETLTRGGVEGYLEAVREDPAILARLREACLAARTLPTTSAVEEVAIEATIEEVVVE